MNAAKKEQAQSTKNLLAASIVKKAAELEVCVRVCVCVVHGVCKCFFWGGEAMLYMYLCMCVRCVCMCSVQYIALV